MALHEPLRIAEDFPHQGTGRLTRLGKHNRWIAYGLGGVILLLLAWYFIAPLFAPKKKPPPPPPVKVAVAHRGNMMVMQNTIGTVVSPAMVQVTAQVTGKLLVANFREGDIVHKGDVLFQIDPAPYQAALDQAQGQLVRDTATLANDQVDLSRYQVLMKQNAIAEQQVATQQAKVKSDQGVVVSDQANVEAARINLNFTRITSPIDGKTGPIFIQPGNVIPAASATSQPLVTITQIQPIKVSFQLPQNGLAQIQNQFNQKKLMAIVPMAGAPGGSEKAPVDFVSNVVNPSTGTIELRADFPNTDMRLVPGQTVNVSATMNQIAGAILVPRDAVNLGPDNSFVWVVDQDNKVSSRTVQVLNDNGVDDAIRGDVKPGDRLVVEGQLRINPGQVVRVTKGAPAAPHSDTEP